jgi:hypothetical protein
LPEAALDAAGLARDRAWLAAPPEGARAAQPAWWQRWYVWGPLAAAAVAVTAFALGNDSEPARRLRVVVVPGDAGR